MIDSDRAQLDHLADVLFSCRTLYQSMWDQKFYEPSATVPSAAWADFQLLETGADGTLWPLDLHR